MGFDITFHPTGLEEIQYYLFDVIENHAIAKSRVSELTSDSEVREYLLINFYSKFDEWFEEILKEGHSSPLFSGRFAFLAAQISGFLHPFWYARGQALSFLAEASEEVKHLIKPLTKITDGKLKGLSDISNGLITENYKASGFISDLDALLKILDELCYPKNWQILSEVDFYDSNTLISKYFDEEGIDSLNKAIKYAQSRKLGLMEGADVCGPFGCYTKYENMRAHYLQNTTK